MSDEPTGNGSDGPDSPSASQRTRAYSQLLRQQERARRLLQRITDELEAPVTGALLGQLENAPSERVRRRIAEVTALVEDAKRVVWECESEIHRSLVTSGREPVPTEPANLPPALSRFLAERKESSGFTFDVKHDVVRGWVVQWKDRAEHGSVLGGGQFYEKPYAWLES